jgi:hypothetical protein
MTKADEFIRLWRSPERTIQASTLVARIDSRARKTRVGGRVEYRFTDSSIVYNAGRGWKLMERASQAFGQNQKP